MGITLAHYCDFQFPAYSGHSKSKQHTFPLGSNTFIEFHQNQTQLPRYKPLQRDRQTDTHTDRQTDRQIKFAGATVSQSDDKSASLTFFDSKHKFYRTLW